MRENVINFAQQGMMSKKLATIETNVPIDFDEECLKVKEPNLQYLTELFEELEFRTFLTRFMKGKQVQTSTPIQVQSPQPSSPNPVSGQLDLFGDFNNEAEPVLVSAVEPILVNTDKQLYRLVENLRKAESYVIYIDDKGISLSPDRGEVYKLPMSVSMSSLSDIFSDTAKTLIGHNVKSDISFLAGHGIEVKNKLWDCMIAHYLIEPELNHSIEYIADVYVGIKLRFLA